jgi:NitT/TauT family transport system substrate-binding protein
MRKFIVVPFALFAIFLAGCFRGAPAKPPKSVVSPPGAKLIHVGIENTVGCGAGFVALQKGYFNDLEVEFTIEDDWSIRQQAFLSGKIQMDVTTIDAFAISVSQNMKGSLFLVLDESNGDTGMVTKPEIKTPADLKGRKVAYAKAHPSHFFLVRYLKQNGLTMDDIDRVAVDDPSKASEELANGTADAAITGEPSLSRVVKSGKGQVLIASAAFPHQLVDVMAVNSDLLEHRKGDIQKFTDGWLKGVEYIRSHPVEAHMILAKVFHSDEKTIVDRINGTILADLAVNKEWLLPPDKSRAIQLFDDATAVWVDEKLISTPKAGKDQFNTTFIENAQLGPIPGSEMLAPNSATP